MKHFFLFFLFIPLVVSAQTTTLRGTVIDGETNKPLPFASVLTNTRFITLTDVDGNFFIQTDKEFNQLNISYVGFQKVKIPINKEDKFIKVELQPSVEKLNEVLIHGTENPALRLIRTAIANKSKNNIEKALKSFRFNAYNKILVTANPDSISGRIDSIFKVKEGVKTFVKLDSSDYEFKKQISRSHLYISEKISEVLFQKGKKRKEVVLASRMAGLKRPIYEILAIPIQDFSFYNEYYTVAGTKYINPIAKNALKKYNYKILDTVSNGNRQSYMIYFKPKEKEEIVGIEGVLYLDTTSLAITKAIAELKGLINIKTTQNFDYFAKNDIWFPSDMNIVIRKGDTRENISLFGGVIKVSQSNKETEDKASEDTFIKRDNKPEDITYFISKSTFSNFEMNTPVIVKGSSSTIEFNDDSHKKDELFWNEYRSDSITKRGQETYKLIDSIAEGENIDKKIDFARNLLKGYYPTKYVNLNLGKIINLNNHEGLRIGFGGETNAEFSPKFKLISYVAYGTKDSDWKYSFGGEVRFNKRMNTWFGANYTDDLKEAGALNFIAENTSFSPVNPRNLNLSDFYGYKTYNVYLKHDIQANLEARIQLSKGTYTPVFEYRFLNDGKDLQSYRLSTAVIGLQYNPKNEYMNSPVGKLRLKNEFPQMTFQLTKSFEDVMDGDFDFTQINFRVLHEFKRLRRATTSISVDGGIVFGDAPISHLYNATPNYSYKNPWIKRITFAGKNSFETMGYNEFISDKFLAVHVKHILNPFEIGRNFKPQLTLATRAAIGDIDHPEYHTEMNFMKMNEGYIESGMELNNLYKLFGLSAFYRYGPYSHTDWYDNLAVKLTFKISLGF